MDNTVRYLTNEMNHMKRVSWKYFQKVITEEISWGIWPKVNNALHTYGSSYLIDVDNERVDHLSAAAFNDLDSLTTVLNREIKEVGKKTDSPLIDRLAFSSLNIDGVEKSPKITLL